jgi:hypothetical protein
MDAKSLGPIQLADASLPAINDAFRQLVDRIDESKGLRGRAQVYDRLGVSAPTQASDAAQFDNTQFTDLTLNTLTMNGTIRVLDAQGHLIHAFGAIA